MEKGKPGVMIYFETAKAIKGLDYETKGRLFEAIMEYAENGVIPAFDGVLAAVWPFLADKIERDAKRYGEVVNQKKRASYERWWKKYAKENGLDENDQESKERWIDMQMKANAPECNAGNADASFAMQNMPTGTATGTATAPANGNANGAGASTVGTAPASLTLGRYKNVLLTDVQLAELKAEYPSEWETMIENLSSKIEIHGYKLNNHLATMRLWAEQDAQKKEKKQDQQAQTKGSNIFLQLSKDARKAGGFI